MQTIKELQRQPAPAGRPQPLAFYDGKLWVGCWDVDKLYGIDVKNWDVVDEVKAPGRPYGLAASGGGLSVVVALDDDDRYLFRFVPGRGFDAASKTACPDLTGSHIAFADKTLYLCQLGKRRVLALDEHWNVVREIALPTRLGGLAFDGSGKSFFIAADEEFEDLEFARIDLQQSAPGFEVLGKLPFDGRGVAFDGTNWWSSVREEGEIAQFSVE
jgi:hypothetical protein